MRADFSNVWLSPACGDCYWHAALREQRAQCTDTEHSVAVSVLPCTCHVTAVYAAGRQHLEKHCADTEHSVAFFVLPPCTCTCTGRVLSGTLTLGQQRRGAVAAPATTPFSFLPLPAAPKKEETKAAGSSKPKPAEQRVRLLAHTSPSYDKAPSQLLLLTVIATDVHHGDCLPYVATHSAAGSGVHHHTPALPLPNPSLTLQLSEALRDAKLGLLKDLKADSPEDAALAQQLVTELKSEAPGYLPLLLEIMRRWDRPLRDAAVQTACGNVAARGTSGHKQAAGSNASKAHSV